MLDRAIRELDRERAKIEAQEKKTIVDMKKAARAGQQVRMRQRVIICIPRRHAG